MQKIRFRTAIYLLAFVLSLQMAIPAYINSSFIEAKFASTNLISILYTLGSIVTILSLFYLTKTLKRIGNTRLTLALFIINGLSFGLLTFSNQSNLIILAFIALLVLGNLIYFNLDIFLEKQTLNDNTGGIRGKYMTTINLAWLISPIIAGFILEDNNYRNVYFISLLLTVPFLILLGWGFYDFKDPQYEEINFTATFKRLKKKKDIFNIFILRTYLSFFYSWMVIYTPIYLHQNIGLDWSQIGIIFTIMLLPFVLLEIPVGKIADKFLGEKEIMNVGIVILSLATILLSIISVKTLWVWGLVLFLTRVGASLLEITAESYFFKQIDAGDSNIISFFRMSTPLAYLLGPLSASLVLVFVDFQFIFLVLGIICLTALKFGLEIVDTK
ncbi:MAG: MFS transporter [Patescibacteria group bacterium]